MPAVSGTVKDANGNFARRLARVHRRDTGALVGEALSNPSTGAWSVTTADYSKHYAVAHDIDAWITYLAMNGTNGSTSFAEWGGKTVTVYGNAQIKTDKYAPLTGNASSAYFDGTNSYLAIPNSPNLLFGTGDFTVEAWIYPTNTSGLRSIFIRQSLQETAFQLRLNAGVLEAVFRDYITLAVTTVTGGTVSANTWTHVAVCRSGGSVRLYVAGTGNAATPVATNFGSNKSDPATVGALATEGFSQYFAGYIDDLRISKGVARYTANFTPPTAPHGDALALMGNAMIYDHLTPV